MLKTSHDRYIEEILDLAYSEDPETPKSSFTSKKLFSMLKRAKQDSSGLSPLLKDGELNSDNKRKADVLNQQFVSVFTPKSPLSLHRLTQISVIDQVEKGDIPPSQVPTDCQSKFPTMQPLTLSVNGILKLFKDLNPHKAAGPDHIKPLVLRELREVLAPVIQVIFQKSIDTGRVPADWKNANVCPVFKKGDKCEPSNYRPISLTCVLCKLMEHIVVPMS